MIRLITTRPGRIPVMSFLVALLLLTGGPGMAAIERSPATADHSKFESLKGPFDTASDVTSACLECHTEAAGQIKETTHWTWLYKHAETGQTLGRQWQHGSAAGLAGYCPERWGYRPC